MTTGITMGNVAGIYQIAATIDPGNVAAASIAEQTFVLTGSGLKVGDSVLVTKPTVTASFAVIQGRVSAADTLVLTIQTTTTNINAPSEIYTLTVFRPSGGVAANTIAD